MRRLTTDEFIFKAKNIHGEKYDYSKTYYIDRRSVVDIICYKHGLFQQNAGNHLAGQNCPICEGRGKGNNKRFVDNAVLVHGNKYDYSNVNYINSHSKITISCPIHGEFEQSPTRHLYGDGCPKCNGGVSITQEEFIIKAKNVHGDKYDYSLVNYINSIKKIKIICNKHGVFEQKPNGHLNGQGCGKCAIENKCLTTEDFINKANNVHSNLYDYSLVNYEHNNIKIKIICPIHGVFEQKPNSHLNGRGCSKCKLKSKGEIVINNWLIQNNIDFEIQKSFSDCRNILPLRFDFYLPKQNLLIEYDGEPHFKEVEYLGGKTGFELRKTNDNIKTEYAKNNNLNLLRIPYTERKNISQILKNNIKY